MDEAINMSLVHNLLQARHSETEEMTSSMDNLQVINPRRACTARVTVVVLCVCLSVCLRLFSDYRLRGGL